MKTIDLIDDLKPNKLAEALGLTVSDLPNLTFLGEGKYKYESWKTGKGVEVEIQLYLDGPIVRNRVLSGVISNAA